MLNAEVDKFFKDLSAVNQDKAVHEVTIHAHRDSMVSIGGSNHRGISPAFWCVVLISLLTCHLFWCTIGVSKADRFSSAVRSVSRCENKPSNQIHREMQERYGYNRYSDMSIVDYHMAMCHLSKRKCDN